MRLSLFAAFLLSSAVLPAQDDPLWHYVHPKARALVGIEWKRVATSEVGLLIRDELRRSVPPSVPVTVLLDGVERILLSSPGNPPGSKSEAPVLIAMAGRFQRAAVQQALKEGTSISRYHGYEVFSQARSRAGEDLQLAFASPELLLLGDRTSLRSALDSTDVAIPSSPVITRARASAAQNDVWAVFDVPPSTLAGNSDPRAAAFRDVRGLDLAVSFRQGLNLSLTLQALTGEKAAKMAQTLTGLMALASLQASNQADMQQLAQKLHVETKGAAVHIALGLSTDEVRQGLRQAKGSFRTRPGALASAVVPPPRRPSPALPEKPPMVRIYGMPGGPVEIPMKP